MNTSMAGLASSSQSVNFLRYAVRVWCGAGKHTPNLRQARVIICVSLMRNLGVGGSGWIFCAELKKRVFEDTGF